MTPTKQGSIRLFRFAGIDVFLHWSWFVIAFYQINNRSGGDSSLLWNALEYLALFALVTMHEFGHALACRSVGGKADQIVLWPFGGVAYVDPPQRPGAVLWSLAAGPLVNVALAPVLTGLMYWGRSSGWPDTSPNGYACLHWVWVVNLSLLIFNMLPVYPLDGGQILRALLWFPIGRVRSLMVATIIGLVGVVGLIGLAVWMQSLWFGALVVFILMNCWRGLQQARAMMRVLKSPRRDGFACPSCRAGPPIGAFWVCGKCRTAFDMFETQAVCPKCATQFAITRCLECGALSPVNAWAQPAAIPITPV
jgi:Zn-dependent protease